MVKGTDRPPMTIAVDMGRKETKNKTKNKNIHTGKFYISKLISEELSQSCLFVKKYFFGTKLLHAYV